MTSLPNLNATFILCPRLFLTALGEIQVITGPNAKGMIEKNSPLCGHIERHGWQLIMSLCEINSVNYPTYCMSCHTSSMVVLICVISRTLRIYPVFGPGHHVAYPHKVSSVRMGTRN